MPLIKSKSKKAFEHNFKAEMAAGKPKDQSLAISYSVKRKAPKKKASGGTVSSGSSTMNYADGGKTDIANYGNVPQELNRKVAEMLQQKKITKEQHDAMVRENNKGKPKLAEGGTVSASNEKRPMPNMKYNDSMQVGENANKKELIDDQWTSRPDIKQSTKGMKTTPIKHPKMVPQSGYSSRMRDEEDDLQSSASVNNGPQTQPPAHDNEEEATKSGSTPHDESEDRDGMNKGSGRNDGIRMLAEGGEINDFEPMSEAEEDNVQHPAGLESDNDEMHPPKEEYMADHMQMLAEGGIASEDEIEHAASIAAAIMARRKMAAGGSVESGSEDMNMAEGGEVDLELNSTEQPNEYPPMNGEALDWDDDADYLDKEQPEDSNMTGDAREDEESDPHGKSLASKIRAKAKAAKKSPITR